MNHDIALDRYSGSTRSTAQAIHSLFESIADSNPSQPALVCATKQLTYGELNAESNKVANYLTEKGVAPEELIGIFCTRSFEMIIALMGILKAGGAYLPLDPDYPANRLAMMIEETQLKLILTNDEPRCRTYAGPEIQDINDIPIHFSNPRPHQRINSNHLAYAIFTSGSSGKPKASLLEHKGLINISGVQIDTFSLDRNSRVLQFASLSFDAATWEWVMALCSGASLYLLVDDEVHSPSRLDAYVHDHQITHATLPPAILSSLRLEYWKSVTHLVIAGESCNLKTAKIWAKGRNLFNAYGPSEVTICATIAKFFKTVDLLHLGKPIANTCVYVMDENLNQVKQGELYIGGIGLSRGYLHRDELNANKFIPNPDKDSPFHILYRSGDLVKIDQDERLIFIGRADDQVKIRGSRVELGEIEAVLLQHPEVAHAVVMARNLSGDGKAMVAWVVPINPAYNASALEIELHQYLKEMLPSFMQVARIILLDRMPLTENNKIDKKALTVPEFNRRGSSLAFPSNDIEQRLSEIWKIHLGMVEIGTTDEFYWLGGDSISAAKIINQINNEFNDSNLTFSQFIAANTIKGVAEIISKKNKASSAIIDVKVSRSDIHDKISSIQRHTLFIHSRETEVPYCNNPILFAIDGSVDLASIEKSMQVEISRNEILRSVYTIVDGEWTQLIRENIDFSVDYQDLSNHQHKDDRLDRYIDQQQSLRFDLAAEAPLRAFLLKLSNNQYVLGFILHQIAFDGVSASLFIKEVFDNYRLIINDKSDGSSCKAAASAPFQYRDYTHWQNLLREHPKYNDGLKWWKDYLKGAPELHSIPLDLPRPVRQTYGGKTLSFSLEKEQYEEMQCFARNHHLSLFTLLQASLFILIGHYSDQKDILTGIVSAGRLTYGFQESIGNFANILALRENVDGTMAFESFLKKVKNNIAGAFDHQWVFFDDIVEYIKPKRSQSHSPLVQIMLVFQNEQQPHLEMGGVTVKTLFACPGVAKFDLAIHVYPGKDKLCLRWEYNTALFKESTIQQLNRYFLNVVKQGINNPALPISAIELLPQSDLDSHRPVAHAENLKVRHVYHQFSDIAKNQPDNPAIYENGIAVTYAKLSSRVDLIAQLLVADDLTKQTLVAVCSNKNADLVASMLAIFKAGHVYLPIDPKHPQERVDYIINHAKASIIITTNDFVDRFVDENLRLINIDKISDINPRSIDVHQVDPRTFLSVDDLAYVIYTSGSTGKPKGVMVPHRSLAHSLMANCNRFRMSASDVMPTIGSQAFGVSILEFLMPLVSGGAIKVITPETVKDLDKLILETQEVTVLHAVPSLMKNWLRAVARIPHLYPRLRLLITGGEAVPLKLLHELREWNSELQVLATYGMTEATVICAAYEPSTAHNGAYYLGRAYPNCYFRILNHHRRQQPPGACGELYIGGPCLAKGYLHDPELTQSRFIQDPYNEDQMLYQTGDQVHLEEDGNLEFLGRVDNQINLRGMRIEYGEIESVLMDIPEVQHAIVSIKPLIKDEDALVAYLLLKPGMDKSMAAIREQLHRLLPDYMCPDLFVTLDQIPLNANGKIDRNALPLPTIDTQGATPSTRTEITIASIWQEILSIPTVPVDKTFFELGGNSLLLTKVINRLRSQENIALSLTDLFNAQTVREVAKEIDSIRCNRLIKSLTDTEEVTFDPTKEILI